MNGSDIVNAEKALAAARKALRRNEDFVVESKPHHGGVVVTISVVSHSAQLDAVIHVRSGRALKALANSLRARPGGLPINVLAPPPLRPIRQGWVEVAVLEVGEVGRRDVLQCGFEVSRRLRCTLAVCWQGRG